MKKSIQAVEPEIMKKIVSDWFETINKPMEVPNLKPLTITDENTNEETQISLNVHELGDTCAYPQSKLNKKNYVRT